MKPSLLKAGDRVLIAPSFGTEFRHGVFMCRKPRMCGRKAYSVIHVDEYVGLRGSTDLGETHFSDYEVTNLVELEGAAE
jgi:hypothetical protein